MRRQLLDLTLLGLRVSQLPLTEIGSEHVQLLGDLGRAAVPQTHDQAHLQYEHTSLGACYSRDHYLLMPRVKTEVVSEMPCQ
jgi:hypothetical protein